jgi:hypothetical protein
MRRVYRLKLIFSKRLQKLVEVKDYLLFTEYDRSNIVDRLKELGVKRTDVIITK